ncbi:CGNR zinc finger domain-containing protein [Streptomyces sp. NPDC047002]|uniref:CGNR zinc finger domain-containing protein n=1 Tax=Streptomyces sp. NPDC047002 TaxID=3155475 RepID=UPI0034567B33
MERATALREALLGEPLPVELMNSVHIDRGGPMYDLVGDADVAGCWVAAIGPRLPALAAGGPAPAPAAPGTGAAPAVLLDEADARRLCDLRAALRALAAEVTGAPPQFTGADAPAPEAAVETVNRLSGLAPVWPVLAWPAGEEPAEELGTDAGYGDLVVSCVARQAVELFAGPRRARLRACLAPGCDRYFVKDHSRREWCTRSCGNRARVARHYRRHHGAPAGRPDAAGQRH